MSKCGIAVPCLAVLFAVFLALDVIFLGATIGLASYGIVEAGNENSCSAVNSTRDCVLPLLIQLSIVPNGSNETSSPPARAREGQIPGFNFDLYLYWMAGATACGLVWAVINVVTLIVFNELIRTHLVLLAKLENEVVDGAHEMKKLVAKGSDETQSASKAEPEPGDKKSTPKAGPQQDPTPKAKPKPDVYEFHDPDKNMNGFTDKIGAFRDPEWLHKPLRHFGPLSTLSLFLSSLSFACALLCLVWGIAISFNHARQDARNVFTFVIVEVLVAVALPIFLCASVVFFAVALEYITIGHLDMRTLVPRLIGMVKFESGEKFDYWVIDDIFYYPLKRKDGRSDKGCWFSVDKSPATWFLVIIICTAFNLVISYFVDLTLDAQISVTSCNDPLIDRSYDCFNASTLNFVDCVNNTATDLLHCFKFYRFGVETNIITAITTSYAFYLVTVAVFKQIISVVRDLVHIKPSRFWGAGFVAVGLIFYAASIIVLVIWIRGYAINAIAEISRINIIHISQFFMVSTFVTMVGGLLLSKWYEKLHTKVHAKVIETPLVHYSDTQRKHLHQIEASDTWPPTHGSGTDSS